MAEVKKKGTKPVNSKKEHQALLNSLQNEPMGRHICLVVKDLEKTMETLSSLLGLGPWVTFEADIRKGASHNDKDKYGTLLIKNGVPGREKTAFTKLAKLGLGNLWLEMIQPVTEGSPADKFLKTKGEGLSHVAIVVPNWEEATNKLEKAGCKVLGKIAVPGGGHSCTMEIQPGGLILAMTDGKNAKAEGIKILSFNKI
jgi:methylmalonyl-CoA/ethylmalonyl-CoA epimerase